MDIGHEHCRAGGSRQDLLIVADDLTGALDAAGSFARPESPIQIWFDPPISTSGRNAVDTDSRDLDQAGAIDRVAAAFSGQNAMAGRTAFKKIDSMMRGHPVAEAVAAFRSGGFQRALMAPAFPAMGRLTIGGRQFVDVLGARGPVGPSLVDALSSQGVPARMIDDSGPDEGFLVADASSDADLLAAVQRFAEGVHGLYVGTAGLASAMAGSSGTYIRPPPIDIAICGTLHPVTLKQIELANAHEAVVMDDGQMTKLPAAPRLLVAPSRYDSQQEAKQVIARSLERVVRDRKPAAIFVTGGWTLRTLSRICETNRLLCIGLYQAGVPVCRMVGGAWDGANIVSKSGGFGNERLLADLFALQDGSVQTRR
jgi:uncharacterized protein YgbK (DUF1537 family)